MTDVDDLETVLVAGSQSSNRVFHVSSGCPAVRSTLREWDLETAIGWGLSPCPRCDGDGVGGDHGSGGHYQTLVAIGESRGDRERSDPWPRPSTADD